MKICEILICSTFYKHVKTEVVSTLDFHLVFIGKIKKPGVINIIIKFCTTLVNGLVYLNEI